MAFWLIVGGLTVIVAAMLGHAVVVRGQDRAGVDAAQSDMAVYRDQLAEVERDLDRGVLSEAEAEAVRTEVARRLLDADRRAGGAEATGRGATAPALVLVAAAVLAGTFGLYVTIGAPGYGDQPLDRRLSLAAEARANRPSQEVAEAEVGQPPEGAGEPQIEEIMEKLRATVAANPDELQGQQYLAEYEARLGRFVAARTAQEAVIRLKGDRVTLDDVVMLLDVTVIAAGGYVSPRAERVMSEVLNRAPENGVALYYAGLLEAQTGRPDRAFSIWRRLIETGPADAPFIPPIRAQIEDLATMAGVRYDLPAAPAMPGPSAEEIAAASDMSAEDRGAMIRGMVDGLSERLATEGGPAPDWARLIQALAVLGEDDRATAILAEARNVFAGDAASLAQIEAAAERAGYP